MKPIKGMNLDVSPDAQPPGTYRIAKNFVYDAEFDGLIQQPGEVAKAVLDSHHAVGHHVFDNGDILLLCTSAANSSTGDSIRLYVAASNGYTEILTSTDLNFAPTLEYDIAAFTNTDDQRVVVITDGTNKPLVINVDLATQPNFNLQYLIPTRTYPKITQNNQTGGSLPIGTYFFSVQYEYDDTTRTTFGPPTGPFRVTEANAGIQLSLTQIDTNYKRIRVGKIQLSDEAITTAVVADVAITGTSQIVYIEGADFDNALLEELAVLPVTYDSAKAVEFHDNRLYLANVTAPAEDASSLQTFANRIEPIWEIKKVRLSTSFESDDPENHKFMPDEVYAFYVAWIRDDGSLTRAYHIPNNTRSSFSLKLAAGAGGVANPGSFNINPKDTLATIMGATGSGQVNENGLVNYLKNDALVSSNSQKYFHTRCTADPFTDKTDRHHGRMGIWENANETYPSTFPAKTVYAWNAGGDGFSGTSSEALAGEKVRHHRMPSLSFLIENVSTFDMDAYKNFGLQVRFDFLQFPAGTKGAIFYHAKRTTANNVVLGHAPIHFGALNTYSHHGIGGDAYKGYSVQSVINCRNANSPHAGGTGNIGINAPGGLGTGSTEVLAAAGNPKEADGTDFETADFKTNENDNVLSFNTEIQDRLGVHYSKAVTHSPDLLALKPALPTQMYTRLEYMLMQEEEQPNDIEGNTASNNNGRNNTMKIDDSTSSFYYSTTDGDGEGQDQARRMSFDFTAPSGLRTIQSFPQSEVLAIENQRYLPAGVIDDDVKFDNRRSPECLYWDYKNITNTDSPYNTNTHHNAGDRLWFSVLNNPDTYSDNTTGDTDNGAYQNTRGGVTSAHVNKAGYFLDTMHASRTTRAVHRLPFVNINAHRVDCYYGYTTQELVACTSVLASASLNNPPTLSSGGSAAGKTVPSEMVHGDVLFSKTQYRVTANAGFDIGFSSSDVSTLATVSDNNAALGNNGAAYNTLTLTDFAVDNGTTSDTVGHVVGLFKVNSISPIDYLKHNKEKLQHKDSDTANLLRPASAAETNDVSYNKNLVRLNDWLQPTVSTDENLSDSFRYRIVRSRQQDAGTDRLKFREFAALDFFEQPRERGVIMHLQSYADKLLIHHEDSLFLTIGKESLQTTTGSVVLGSGDIFRVKPQELAATEYGLGGTQHKQGCVLTPQGYFFVDVRQGKVFLYNGKLKEISNQGMRKWFQDHLELRTDWYSSSAPAVHSYFPGVLAEYDPVFNRVILVIRNNQHVNALNSGQEPGTLSAYTGDTQYTDTTVAVSYSFNNGAWVSLHDFQYNVIAGNADKLYALRTVFESSTVKHKTILLNQYTDSSIEYISNFKTNTKSPAFIDIAFPAQEPVSWQSFSWHTRVKEHDPTDANFGHLDLAATFAKAAVYNDYQCTGDLTFTRASDVDINTVQQVTLRHNGTRYQFNGFRDLVNNTAARFLDPEYNFVTANINANKNWYDQRRFKSTHAVVRLITPETTTKLLYLYDVDAKVRKSYR